LSAKRALALKLNVAAGSAIGIARRPVAVLRPWPFDLKEDPDAAP